MEARVEVIIATTAEPKRADSLLKAINSIFKQKSISARPLVVVNGSRCDKNLCAHLESMQNIKLIYDPKPSAPNAHRVGRMAVTAEYFGFLDDDDLFLPNALEAAVNELDARKDISLYISNGYRSSPAGMDLMFTSLHPFSDNPAESILANNWMASCAGIFRSDDVGVTYFEDYSDYMEWTVVGFKIAQRLNIFFSDEPRYVINVTEGSVSQTEKYVLGCVHALAKIEKYAQNAKLKKLIKRKYSSALHDAAELLLNNGKVKEAFRFHLKSLFVGGGIRYMTFTRFFILNLKY